jgi:hypothetical protein
VVEVVEEKVNEVAMVVERRRRADGGVTSIIHIECVWGSLSLLHESVRKMH